MKKFVYVILSILTVIVNTSPAAPEPEVVQKPYEWTVDVTFEHPQQITLRWNKEKKPEKYWYTIITLTNNTKNDVEFYPECELVTDTFQIVPACRGVPAFAFKQIKQRHQSKYPFLEYLDDTDNRILQGEDNTKDIAIIWPDFDSKAKGINIFIAGLSNETAAVDHPTEKDEAGNPVKIYLRKTLELSYKVSGDAAFRSGANLVYEDKRWIMR